MLLRQAKDEPWADTSILIEYLVHADGATLNSSSEHRWAVHEFPPGKDFYNWTARCLSAGEVFNPYKVCDYCKCYIFDFTKWIHRKRSYLMSCMYYKKTVGHV